MSDRGQRSSAESLSSLPLSTEETMGFLSEKNQEKDLESNTFEKVPSFLRTHYRSLSLRSITALLLRIGFVLLPSFVQNRINGEHHRPDKLFATSYLDGMRGLAAFCVFLCHFSYNCYIITYGWGLDKPEDGPNHYLLQLPIIRLFYSGPPMVCIFFVISGYALSLKPLKQMRAKQFEGLFTTLSSSTFRRGLRLFLPTTASTFMILIFLRMGLYEYTREHANNVLLLRSHIEHHPTRFNTFDEQIRHWVWNMFDFIHVWEWKDFGGSTGYDLHLWTIPAEFRCSMMLFGTLIGLARVKTWIRQTILVMLMYWVCRSDRWDMVLFYAGMFIAEIDLIPTTTEKKPPQSPGGGKQQSRAMKYTWFFLAFIALLLMSQPDDFSEITPGWKTLVSFVPVWYTSKYRFYQSIGSILFIVCCSNQPMLQKPFIHPAVQYLGKISYAIYIMHGMVIHLFGYLVEPWAWRITGSEPGWQYNTGFVLAGIFVVPVTVWAADLFWRAVDTPCVKFAKWFETKCMAAE
ncbi:putative acyltransferase [Aulographum hederae CBS 113979]|uniref:Putative acyltransferase n=1 Tax=Aulographum hederae CBS 113979 TaxID=1176131 RepID=A0A6G1HF88_9PEZI|nr:putative acyltransferase [Aulographum hederae CBS 113979]